MAVVLVLLPATTFAKEEPEYVATKEALYEAMFQMVAEKEAEKTFLIDFHPYEINTEELMGVANEKDSYIAFQLSETTIDWQPVGNQYEVNIKLRDFTGKLQEKRLRKRVKAIAKELQGFSRYEQIKYTYDYIILNCEYDITKNGPYNTLVKGHACCNGYASAFYMIMGELGIPCKYTYNSDHAWNTVYLDGYWYNVDATWGDTGGNTVDYEYFLKGTTDWMGADPAAADAPVAYPAQNLEVRHEFPDFVMRENGKLLLMIAIPVVMILLIKISYGTFSQNSTQNRIAKNEELIRNMYHLPDE